ncbi:polyglutamine-repeat protein pqn-41-like [Cyclospora cayetanensis]|uniref:Polyglutamine-repeat protein pqn-41-like n=1 Tax=Cyclospora cayetanensis TaxID=88456 RepID=A0A6P6RQG8_9EIME|nr:polyglutamine-repeat protein pqn-41-like [Cyclospora cayetanensis]
MHACAHFSLRGGGYDFSVDWWSVGVVLFEMLYGGIPFCPPPKFKGDVPQFVKLQVTNYAIVCPIPYPSPISALLSPEAISLMQRLVCDASMRYKRAADILTHPFFKGLDLKTLFTIEQPLAADTRAYAASHYPSLFGPDGELLLQPQPPTASSNNRDSSSGGSSGGGSSRDKTRPTQSLTRSRLNQQQQQPQQQQQQKQQKQQQKQQQQQQQQQPHQTHAGCLASLRAAARGARQLAAADPPQQQQQRCCYGERSRHIPKQDTNPDDEVDLLFARYPFDRRAEESRPVASQIMNDKRVQAALRAAFEKQPPEKSADSSHTEEAMHGQTDDPLESARDLEDIFHHARGRDCGIGQLCRGLHAAAAVPPEKRSAAAGKQAFRSLQGELAHLQGPRQGQNSLATKATHGVLSAKTYEKKQEDEQTDKLHWSLHAASAAASHATTTTPSAKKEPALVSLGGATVVECLGPAVCA